MENKLTIKQAQDIVYNFEKFIKERTFGFSNCHNSNDKRIIRYDEGIDYIANITNTDRAFFEKKTDNSYYDEDAELTDVRWIFDIDNTENGIVFEYTYPSNEDEETIDRESGWWKVYFVQDGSFEDASKVFDMEEDEL